MPSFRVDRRCSAIGDREQAITNRVEVIEDAAVLRDDVRLCRVRGDVEVTKHRSRVDAAIDSQQGHAHIVVVASCARPEAAVRVTVFGADARMHHERPKCRNRKDRFLEQRFATGDDEIGRTRADVRLGVGCIRRRHDQFQRVRALRKTPAQIIQRHGFPKPV